MIKQIRSDGMRPMIAFTYAAAEVAERFAGRRIVSSRLCCTPKLA
jgi:hypothetical protein